MRICCELSEGCCGYLIRNTVCSGLTHYMIHGIFIVSFVFSNSSYPPFYYPDYAFGGSGAALFVIAFLTACVVDLKEFQFLRMITACLTVLAVLTTVVWTYYYTVERWNDIITTALTRSFRKAERRDLPDLFWYTLVVLACAVCPILLIYLIYIISFMCNDWNSHLFTMPYQNDVDMSIFGPPVTLPPDIYSTRSYKPYPVQPSDRSEKI